MPIWIESHEDDCPCDYCVGAKIDWQSAEIDRLRALLTRLLDDDCLTAELERDVRTALNAPPGKEE